MPTTKPDLQLKLHFSQTEDSLGRLLKERLGRPVSLALTDNSTSMLSARTRDGVLHVRLHRMFLHSDDRVLEEIAAFLKNRKKQMTFFRGFIRDHREQLGNRPPNRITEKTRGKFYDLSELYHEINEEYFGGMVSAAITWGAKSPRYAVRKRTLGSYSERSNTIRINPVLDRKAVPRYYVAFVVYHEMLHAALGILLRGKRRSVHPREFRAKERLFRDYERALAWERGKA
jgi:predicted metal-dependent hydrolase